jgi:serine/threonine-protein kinase
MDFSPSEHPEFGTQGSTINGRFRILTSLGAGGMGTVILAADLENQAVPVALKFLHPHLVAEERTLARFKNEILLACKLDHPNIVRVLGFGNCSKEEHFIVMEYVEGRTLGQVIYGDDPPLEFERILQILAAAASALAYAHERQIVHRDLKPDNILLGKDGSVKLTDFGLARSTVLESSLTLSGETVGTPCYMAPEQFRGEKADARTDVYAFGIMAYEMAAGQRPFQDENYVKVAAMHHNWSLPDLSDYRTDIPQWFQDFIETCAEKKPRHRYQSMSEIQDILRKKMHSRKGGPEDGVQRSGWQRLMKCLLSR